MCSRDVLFQAFPSLSVISEEHDPQPIDMDTVEPMSYSDPEVDAIVTEDQRIPIEEIDVWIDPLDATQVTAEIDWS